MACVRLGRRVGKHFEVRRGMRQGSPSFYILFHKVVRPVNERAAGRGAREWRGVGNETCNIMFGRVKLYWLKRTRERVMRR